MENLQALKQQYLQDIKGIVEMEEIPQELILNWDKTTIHYVPVSSWTMAKEGCKKISIAGTDDKRQITVVLAATMTGTLLPLQLVYQGKIRSYLLSVSFPSGWDVTFTPNHCCNEVSMERFIRNIIVPYIQETREKLQLDPGYRALCIFNNFKAQCTDKILQLLEDLNIDSLCACYLQWRASATGFKCE